MTHRSLKVVASKAAAPSTPSDIPRPPEPLGHLVITVRVQGTVTPGHSSGISAPTPRQTDRQANHLGRALRWMFLLGQSSPENSYYDEQDAGVPLSLLLMLLSI
ncbi:hypothetical protein Q5P01_016665 [Channa striata]|uniref:Uncharacterized protein n=1 Tax=Channa striata TaxID=64152 RepID=A0AA88SCQ5_CHASR|nr:hypothetical protein Q5P01_016665 [Channa striata]